MVELNSIPYNKVYKLKARIPRGEEKLGYGCIGILNNRTLEDSLKIFDNPHLLFISTNYFNFYIDRLYKEKIHTKLYKLNNKEYREKSYELIKTKYPAFKTPITMKAINKKNFYYDLSVYNELFFKSVNGLNIKRKIEIYFKLLAKYINNPMFDESYTSKTLYMDVNSWIKDKKDINNPIMYIFLAYKRYPELLEILGRVDIVLYSDFGILKFDPSTLTKDLFSKFKLELNKMTSKIINIDDEDLDTEVEKEEIKSDVVKQIIPKEKKETTPKKVEKPVKNIATQIDDEDEEDILDDDDEDLDLDFDQEELSKQEEEEPIVTDTDEEDNKPIDEDEEDEVFDDFNEELNKEIDRQIEQISEEDPDLSSDEVAKRIKDNLNEDKKLVSMMHDTIQKKKTGKSSASIKRDEELRKRQKDIKINDKTLDDYLKMDKKIAKIPTLDISNKVQTTNENVKQIKFANFEKSYNTELSMSDTVKIVKSLNEKSIPAYVVKFDIKDSSDELNYKDTYNVILEDENRVRHSLTFDVPKFVDDKFLYINGNKKIITKQLFMKPIAKTSSDTVQICTNYNKIFIKRYGPKLSPKLEKFKRAATLPAAGMTIINGDNRLVNKDYKTTIEYDDLAESFSFIKTKDFELVFNQEIITRRLGNKKLNADDFCIGFYKDNSPIIMSYKTELIDGKYDIVDFILSNAPDKFITNYNSMKTGTNRYSYTRAKVMEKNLPVLLLVGYCEGLTEVLKKANIKHRFSDTRPTNLSDNEAVVKFADCYFIYDRYPYENSLLLNALSILPTPSLNYEDMDDKDVYVELFYEMFRARNLANAFDSFYEFMIDPITKEILEDFDYPTDFVSVVLFANALLADNSYILENDMNLYRVRSNEIVNAIIYRKIADAYGNYRATANNTSPKKISIPKDVVIKELMAVNTVEEYSTLNPIYETEKLRSITPRGYRGMNSERAFTLDKRSYDKSMIGILGISTSPDGNVGIVRKLSMEPNITGPRGYINIETDESKLKDVNLFTSAEMLTPMGVTHDDSPRTAMSSKQSGHIIPVHKASPVLVSNGAEQVIQYNLSKDFVIIAEDDGEVVEVNTDTGYIMVKYKNGKSQAIDINPKVVKNSSSGFYISNKLDCDLKLGDKVKKNDVIAYDDKFFTNDGHNNNRFNIGSLQKIAIMTSYATFEDSTFVTKKMSEDMSSEIVMMKDVIIGKNSNVGKMVKVGDHVQVGDTLIEYDTSFDDEGLNKFLGSLTGDVQDEIKSLNKTPIKSKYSGVIEDIKIYTTLDTEELSLSLQKIVNEYYKGINKRRKLLEKYDDSGSIIKAGVLFTEATGKVKPAPDGSIKGKKIFDGVLIEFYIKYFDPIGVGDKITFYSALKSIVGEVIDEGYEPYSEFRPDEEISSFLGAGAILARMVPSALLVMFTNKVLIELKHKLADIYKN